MNFLVRSQPLTLTPFDEETLFWVVDLRAIREEEAQEAERLLDPQTLQHIHRLRFEEDRQKSLISHGVLQYHLSQWLNIPMGALEISRDDRGKPYLKNHVLHFNLSHTRHYAFIGLHPRHPIGVDIEMIQPDLDTFALSEFSFCLKREKRFFPLILLMKLTSVSGVQKRRCLRHMAQVFPSRHYL